MEETCRLHDGQRVRYGCGFFMSAGDGVARGGAGAD